MTIQMVSAGSPFVTLYELFEQLDGALQRQYEWDSKKCPKGRKLWGEAPKEQKLSEPLQ